jgi:hypothetical protein
LSEAIPINCIMKMIGIASAQPILYLSERSAASLTV